MMRTSPVFVLALFSLSVHCGGAPVPEVYGVYALDRGELTPLGDDTPEEERRDFNGDVEILVFDKLVGSGLVSSEKILTLHSRRYLRMEVERVLEDWNGREKEINVVRSDRFITETEALTLRFKPFDGQPEILIAQASQPLKPGLYTVRFADHKAPFAVGLRGSVERESEHNGCVDQTFETVDKSAPFSWEKWQQLVEGGLEGRNTMSSGNTIVESYYNPCSLLDDHATTWREEVLEAIDNQWWDDAVHHGRAVLQVNPNDQELEELVYGALSREAHQALEQERWSDAIVQAERAQVFRPDDPEMNQLLTKAREEALISEAEQRRLKKRQRQAEAKRKAELLERSKTPNRVIGTFPFVYSPYGLKYKPSELTVTDVDVQRTEETLPGYVQTRRKHQRFRNPDDLRCWFGKVGRLYEVRKRTSPIQGESWATGIENCWGDLRFETEEEASAFSEALANALETWRAEYGDAM